MRAIILIVLVLFTHRTWGQNGYVRLDNDSTLVGYLRYCNAIEDGSWGIEFWRTKKDKNPRKISRRVVQEYAIKKDTFKVLHQFKPFTTTETYFEMVDAKLESRGKVNLYVIENYGYDTGITTERFPGMDMVPPTIDKGFGNYSYMYILEDGKTGFLRALPSKKDKLWEPLMDFFPEKYVLKYAEVKGEIKYPDIPDLVKLYNSK